MASLEDLGVARVPQPGGGPCWFACRACGFNTGDAWGIMVHAARGACSPPSSRRLQRLRLLRLLRLGALRALRSPLCGRV